MEALILVAEINGSKMFARIGVTQRDALGKAEAGAGSVNTARFEQGTKAA
jgi:hypothetical protein